MATKNNPEGNTSKGMQSLEFKTGFEGQPDKSLNVVAYVFDRQGTLLASKPLQGESVQLDLNPAQARTARIFFGPEHPRTKGEKPITLDTMESIHAYEATWTFEPQKRVYELLPIPEYLWKWWFLCSCRVRGQVVKPVNIAGVTTDLPVCNARVHICEVDPIWWIIPRLPDPIIVRLRDELLAEIERPRPIPLPDPPPFVFDPGVIDPSPENVAVMNRATLPPLQYQFLRPGSAVELNPQPEPPGFTRISRGSEVMLNPQPLPPKESMSGLASLAIETRTALTSPSVPVVRQALQNNIALIRPYLCIWYWLWPYLCRCDEIAVLPTDAQGRFDTTIWYFCFGDHPDLYFWVEYCIGGSWTTVYHPNPICCHTYWDYVCGSEVTLRVTDPRVVPCGNPPPDLPGLQVSILSIGQGVSMHQIPVDSTDSAPYSGSATEGLAYGANPFGGQLEPRVNFSRSALFALNITHYRWSYRQLTAGDGVTHVSDTWHAMDRQVIRHYQVYDPVTSSLSFPAYPLGPDPAYPGQNLFQIQPINAPTGFAEDWTPNVDSHEDSASAFFMSHLTQGGNAVLGAGKYELKFELFHTAGGTATPVNLTTSGIALKVADVNAPFGSGTVTTVDADDHHRFKDGVGNTLAFRLVLHVDNNVCDSAIYPISGIGLTVDADCGFIQYQPGTSAHISFMASHPHDFATFTFSTVRGTATGVPDAEAAGQVNVAAANGFVRTGNVFSKDVLVNTLLTVNTAMGHTPCTKAAFSEMLIVQAMATDGWQLLSYLNPVPNPKQAAYALEPA
jgi:hypothetical protein